MALTASDYQGLLSALVPPGKAWPTDPDSRFQRLLAGLAPEFARVDARAKRLLDEADPRQALYLFDEWESSYGLPSDCAPAEQSMADRSVALIGRIVGQGGMRGADYIALAEGLGYPGTMIIEPREATVEVETATGYVGSQIGDDINDVAWESSWTVLIPNGVIRQSVVDEAVIGDPLRSWGDELVECALRGARPSWLILQIGYLEG